MRRRRPKPSRIKALTGNPASAPSTDTSRGRCPRCPNVRLS
jgi:hypothetical protein